MILANGLIPDALLVFADGTQRLRVGTAGRWAWVAQQVQARYGWTPHIISGGGYRSLQQQVSIFTARYVPSTLGSGPFGDVRWWNGVRYIRTSSAGAAAIPGTSNHGLGRAVDVDGLLSFGSDQHAQFAAVAAQAGFTDTEGRAVGEPWHWVDNNDPDVTTVSATVVAPTVAVTTPPPTIAAPAQVALTTQQEDDMPVIYDAPGRGLWLADGSGPLVGIATTGEADALTARGVQRLPVTAAVLDQLRAGRIGVEVIWADPNGFAIGVPGYRYIPLGDGSEVDHWKALAGGVTRTVSPQTFANLTA